MGKLWDLIEGYRDGQKWPPSLRAMAKAVGVSPTAFTNWREPRDLPDPKNLRALSELIGVPYLRVLEAALTDAGYHERLHDGNAPAKSQAEVSSATGVVRTHGRSLDPDPGEQGTPPDSSPPQSNRGGRG